VNYAEMDGGSSGGDDEIIEMEMEEAEATV
jgi:hypothetical protein